MSEVPLYAIANMAHETVKKPDIDLGVQVSVNFANLMKWSWSTVWSVVVLVLILKILSNHLGNKLSITWAINSL